jgi:hypothetical protein
MGILPIGAGQGDVIVQAPQMFEDVLEGVQDGLLERAVVLPLCVPEGTQQGTVLFGILGHVILPTGMSASPASQSP